MLCCASSTELCAAPHPSSLFVFYTWEWLTQHRVHNIGCNVHDIKVQVPLQICECQFKWNQPLWVTQLLTCNNCIHVHLYTCIWNSSDKTSWYFTLILNKHLSNALNSAFVFFYVMSMEVFFALFLWLGKLYSSVTCNIHVSVGTKHACPY